MRRVAIVMAMIPAVLSAQSNPADKTPRAGGNPILSDGRYYSADPAPLVDGDTLYVLAGRDEAPADVNDFIMNEWQLLVTADPAAHRWRHYPAVARPEGVFKWAEPGRAYASQIIKARDASCRRRPDVACQIDAKGNAQSFFASPPRNVGQAVRHTAD